LINNLLGMVAKLDEQISSLLGSKILKFVTVIKLVPIVLQSTYKVTHLLSLTVIPVLVTMIQGTNRLFQQNLATKECAKINITRLS